MESGNFCSIPKDISYAVDALVSHFWNVNLAGTVSAGSILLLAPGIQLYRYGMPPRDARISKLTVLLALCHQSLGRPMGNALPLPAMIRPYVCGIQALVRLFSSTKAMWGLVMTIMVQCKR